MSNIREKFLCRTDPPCIFVAQTCLINVWIDIHSICHIQEVLSFLSLIISWIIYSGFSRGQTMHELLKRSAAYHFFIQNTNHYSLLFAQSISIFRDKCKICISFYGFNLSLSDTYKIINCYMSYRNFQQSIMINNDPLFSKINSFQKQHLRHKLWIHDRNTDKNFWSIKEEFGCG